MRVRFLTPAEIEMFEASVYYENQVSTLGDDFLNVIEEAVDDLAAHPQAWPEIEKGVRRQLVRRFPYSLIYAIHENEIVILAVMHHKQKPNYWIDRL